MLVIPFDRKLDWRRPPLATIGLVLVNVLVFFLFQANDDHRLAAAVDYYYGSGLHEIELPRYRDHLRQAGDEEFLDAFESDLAEPASPWLFRMQSDADFMQRLYAGQVVAPSDPIYPQWQQQRSQFEHLLSQITSFGWGYIPARPTWYSAVAHMFLHGDIGHLLGNMFFLFAVGFLVEGAIGPVAVLLSYLVTGFGALALFALVEPNSSVPLVGASGAIAGLMGMYAVLFGRRRISFFYYVLIYFDYVKAPAILLLGLWLGFELIQYFWLSPDSSVAYMAHVGGLLSGAAVALLLKLLPRAVDEEYLAENDTSGVRAKRVEEVVAHMERLDFAKAVPLLEQLLQDHPNDRDLLTRLLTCTGFAPADDAYHNAVHRVLSLTASDSDTDHFVIDTYRDYLARAKPKTRMTVQLVRKLMPRLVRLRQLPDAERLLAVMLKNPQSFPEAAAVTAQIANLLMKQQQAQRGRQYFMLLLERFPTAPEAELARRVLQI